MDQQLFELLTNRLDRQDTSLERIETKLEGITATKSGLSWLKWIVGGAWAAILALFSAHFQKN